MRHRRLSQRESAGNAQDPKRIRFCENNFLGSGFRKTETESFLKFGGVSDSHAGEENSKYKFNMVPRSFLDVLSCLSVGITLGIRLGHFRYGYSRLCAYVWVNNSLNGSKEPFARLPTLLGERKFPLPGSGSPTEVGVCPRHPHSTFFISNFCGVASLLNLVLQFRVGAHPSAMDAHSGNARGANANTCPENVRVRTFSTHPCAYARTLP